MADHPRRVTPRDLTKTPPPASVLLT